MSGGGSSGTYSRRVQGPPPLLPPPTVTRSHASELLKAASPDYARSLALRCVPDNASAVSGRSRALVEIRSSATALAHRRLSRASMIPAGTPYGGVPLATRWFSSEVLNFSDTDLANDITLGMDIRWATPATNTIRPRARVPTASFDGRSGRTPETNRGDADRAMARHESPEATAFWNLSSQEASIGWISRPNPITLKVSATLPLTPMIACPERRGQSAATKY